MIGRDDDGIERADLSAIAGEPRRIFVAESDVQREAIAHLEIVLHVHVPVVGLTAEGVGGERARHLTRIAEQEVRERIAGAGRTRGIRGDRSVEVPLPRVLLAVGEERDPAPVLAADLGDVAALDPGDVVGHLPHLQVLRLRPLIERRSVHRGVAAPREVGERSADAGTRGLFEAAHARARILLLALEIRFEVDDGGHVAESRFVQQVRRDSVLVMLSTTFCPRVRSGALPSAGYALGSSIR